MNVLIRVHRILCIISIGYLLVVFLGYILAASCSLDWADSYIHGSATSILCFISPAAVLVLALRGFRKRDTPKDILFKVGFTVLGVVLVATIQVLLILADAWETWSNGSLLYRSRADTTVTINVQILDIGALGYGGARVAQVQPVFGWWVRAVPVDTAQLNPGEWRRVDESRNGKAESK